MLGCVLVWVICVWICVNNMYCWVTVCYTYVIEYGFDEECLFVAYVCVVDCFAILIG